MRRTSTCCLFLIFMEIVGAMEQVDLDQLQAFYFRVPAIEPLSARLRGQVRLANYHGGFASSCVPSLTCHGVTGSGREGNQRIRRVAACGVLSTVFGAFCVQWKACVSGRLLVLYQQSWHPSCASATWRIDSMTCVDKAFCLMSLLACQTKTYRGTVRQRPPLTEAILKFAKLLCVCWKSAVAALQQPLGIPTAETNQVIQLCTLDTVLEKSRERSLTRVKPGSSARRCAASVGKSVRAPLTDPSGAARRTGVAHAY